MVPEHELGVLAVLAQGHAGSDLEEATGLHELDVRRLRVGEVDHCPHQELGHLAFRTATLQLHLLKVPKTCGLVVVGHSISP